jgi:periodic tryptophan protein 2
VRFSGTGLEWAAASPLGLLVYALDDDLIFDPLDLDEEVRRDTGRERPHWPDRMD